MTPPSDPAPRPPRTTSTETPAELPDLACWTRRLREGHRLPRHRAARPFTIGKEMLKKIEEGRNPAAQSTLKEMIRAYFLDQPQARYTHELALPSIPLPTPEATRTSDPVAHRVRNARVSRLGRRDHLGRRGYSAAYLDPLWNLVNANNEIHAVLPGLAAYDNNVLLWLFHPDSATSPADDIFVRRDDFAAYIVADLRGGLGRHRDSPHALALVRRLCRSETFRTLWCDSTAVAYGRHPGDPIYLRDPATAEEWPLKVYLGEVPGSHLRFWLGSPKTPDGPTPR